MKGSDFETVFWCIFWLIVAVSFVVALFFTGKDATLFDWLGDALP